jgi:hypothetical protein
MTPIRDTTLGNNEKIFPPFHRTAGTYRDLGDLKHRDLRNLNLGDLKKGPKGA